VGKRIRNDEPVAEEMLVKLKEGRPYFIVVP